MRVSRSPEKRGGAGKIIMISALVIAILVVGGLAYTFLLPGSDQAEAGAAQPASGVNTAAAEPEVPAQQVSEDGIPIPIVTFGEVLDEGFVEVNLPSEFGQRVWYTNQVDTTNRQITMYLALYNQNQDTIVRTIQLDGYLKGQPLDDAQVSVHYPAGPKRLVRYNREHGTIQIAQFYDQPYTHSIFTPKLRVALVNQEVSLSNPEGTYHVQLQLDPTGVSDSEQLIFEQTRPQLVEDVLAELRLLVERIEENRVN